MNLALYLPRVRSNDLLNPSKQDCKNDGAGNDCGHHCSVGIGSQTHEHCDDSSDCECCNSNVPPVSRSKQCANDHDKHCGQRRAKCNESI